METVDSAQESLRLSERYRQMTDEELATLARQSSELTDLAQQALGQEMSRRGLKLGPDEPRAQPKPELPPDPTNDEDRELVEVCTVWSLSDALQLQTLLDRAGVPFFMGPEKATGVDAVSSNFADGVSVQIMRIGLPWVREPMMDYTPANDPGPKQPEEMREAAVRCPKCHSKEVIFERLLADSATATDKSPPQYEWTCDSCGHQWRDDGIAKEE